MGGTLISEGSKRGDQIFVNLTDQEECLVIKAGGSDFSSGVGDQASAAEARMIP